MMSAVLIGIFSHFSGLEIFLIILFSTMLGLIPRIFYLLTLYNAMEKVAPENREMPSGQVWLELIPLVNIVWQFINVDRVTRSLEREYYARGKQIHIGQVVSIGRAFCILSLCSFIPFLGSLTGIAALICWIIFWVRIANLKNQL
jgi:hypothetical protein